jgi:hypothetical protein
VSGMLVGGRRVRLGACGIASACALLAGCPGDRGALPADSATVIEAALRQELPGAEALVRSEGRGRVLVMLRRVGGDPGDSVRARSVAARACRVAVVEVAQHEVDTLKLLVWTEGLGGLPIPFAFSFAADDGCQSPTSNPDTSMQQAR